MWEILFIIVLRYVLDPPVLRSRVTVCALSVTAGTCMIVTTAFDSVNVPSGTCCVYEDFLRFLADDGVALGVFQFHD